MHGKGVIVCGKYFYAGDFHNDMKHGIGYEKNSDGSSYDG